MPTPKIFAIVLPLLEGGEDGAVISRACDQAAAITRDAIDYQITAIRNAKRQAGPQAPYHRAFEEDETLAIASPEEVRAGLEAARQALSGGQPGTPSRPTRLRPS